MLLGHGEDILKADQERLRDLRRRRFMVFQHFALRPIRRVIDNVAYGLENSAAWARRSATPLPRTPTLVGLEGQDNEYPDQLSGACSSASASRARWPWTPR